MSGQAPVYDQNGRFLGSTDSGPCPHDQLIYVSGEACGCCDIYRCLHCDKTIRIEVPD